MPGTDDVGLRGEVKCSGTLKRKDEIVKVSNLEIILSPCLLFEVGVM